jgi:hypothetical protein
MSSIEKTHSERLFEWLSANIDAIDNGSAVFEGHVITRSTEIVRFESRASFILFSQSVKTPYFLAGGPEANKAQVTSTMVTCFLGWWSIRGLIYTPFVLAKNISGGEKITVGALIDQSRNPEQAKKQAAAVFSPAYLILGVLAFFFVLAVLMSLVAFVKRSLFH